LSECGITDIKIFDSQRTADRFLQENAEFEYEEVDNEQNGFSMYVSKKTDNLPLTSIKLQ
jgi:hypothetical protein